MREANPERVRMKDVQLSSSAPASVPPGYHKILNAVKGGGSPHFVGSGLFARGWKKRRRLNSEEIHVECDQKRS
jgi:hypothetical protein